MHGVACVARYYYVRDLIWIYYIRSKGTRFLEKSSFFSIKKYSTISFQAVKKYLTTVHSALIRLFLKSMGFIRNTWSLIRY